MVLDYDFSNLLYLNINGHFIASIGLLQDTLKTWRKYLLRLCLIHNTRDLGIVLAPRSACVMIWGMNVANAFCRVLSKSSCRWVDPWGTRKYYSFLFLRQLTIIYIWSITNTKQVFMIFYLNALCGESMKSCQVFVNHICTHFDKPS